MERRDLLGTLLGLSMGIGPLAALAQRADRRARIGIIDDGPLWDYFRDRLHEDDETVGRNLQIEYRVAEGNPDRLLAAAKELAGLPVDVIAVAGSTAAKAAQAATDRVPIVAIAVGDPVAIGLIKNRTRPGGNITGNMTLAPDLAAKRLQLLKSLLPWLSRVAYFWNPNNQSSRAFLDQLQSAARRLRVTMIPVEARALSEFDKALATVANSKVDAMVISGDAVQQRNVDVIVDFQNKRRLPGMFARREDVVAGGLVSYGISVPDLYRRGADMTHKIIGGARLADLPVERPERFELVMNQKAARALGLTIPPPVFDMANEIVE